MVVEVGEALVWLLVGLVRFFFFLEEQEEGEIATGGDGNSDGRFGGDCDGDGDLLFLECLLFLQFLLCLLFLESVT